VSFLCSGQDLSLWREKARQQAIAAQIPPQEVDWLLLEVTDLNSLALKMESFKQRSQILLKYPLDELTQLWQQRTQSRIPVQYLAGQTHWRDFTLKVSPAVLIPRPETELLIDLVLQAVRDRSTSGIWVDLGTGSGAIAIGLADILTNIQIYAVDRSSAALAIAQENISRCGFAGRIHLRQGSWWTPLVGLQGQIGGMVSNPPYIPAKLLPTLQPEVFEHEPNLALDGGEDGLDAIRHLVATAPQYLHSGGIWLIEMMAGQGEAVAGLLAEQGDYEKIQIIEDLAGYDRFALAYRR
jgi:release factor glutamine methyltransferase